MAVLKLLDNVNASTTSAWSTISADGTLLLQSPNSLQLTAGSVKIQMRSSDSGDDVDYYQASAYSKFPNLELSVKNGMQIRAIFNLPGNQQIAGFTLEAIGDIA